MLVLVLIKATEASEAGKMPSQEARDAMERFNEKLLDAGIRRMAAGLKPSAEGKRLVSDGHAVSIVDGPFLEREHLVSGFWLWEVHNTAEAMAWAAQCPNPMEGAYEIELRPLYGASDLGEGAG
ncbi:YciI family protein [Microbulbifer spongiae]|uniref:YciI family protein n=1 Tax=Microbulbifer spongiae TaxID=2944933 RepID=A0ABY9EDQ6_9GAMM|nr:YciI family protein [Microbulbifer sp. MI-G]WKD49669.1 YciI family protein [Microbulbifer sp. MI-G]